MCEVFGYCSKQKADLTPFLKSFYMHSVKHPDGWGIYYEKEGKMDIVKETVRAIDSSTLLPLLDQLEPQNVLLAHIRLASVGRIRLDNCHPFTGFDTNDNQWIQIHNGTIFSCSDLEPYKAKQKGTTDSERILLYLMDQINKQPFNKIETVENVLTQITAGNNKVNYILYDGEYMYVHTNMKHTLYSLAYKGGMLVSTTPLSNDEWKELPLCTLMVYKDGKLIYKGKDHKNEYIL